MSKRLFLTLALITASAFAVTVAAPAHACPDCNCAKKTSAKKSESKPEAKPDSKPADKPTGKPTPDAKKASLGTPSSVLLAAGEQKKCECEKGGKGCTCKKGHCKCANCGQAPKQRA